MDSYDRKLFKFKIYYIEILINNYNTQKEVKTNF